MPPELGSTCHFCVSDILLDLYFWRWSFRVVLNALNVDLAEKTTSFLKMATPHCRATVQSVADSVGIPQSDYSASFSSLLLLVTEEALASARSFQKTLADDGIRFTDLSASEVLEEEPALVPGKFKGGRLFLDDWSGDCGTFVRCLAERLALESGGVVQIQRGSTVESLEWRRGEAGQAPRVTAAVLTDGRRLEGYDHVVIAAGCGSARILRKVGIYLPIYPTKGYALEYKTQDLGLEFRRNSFFVDPLDLFVTQFRGAMPDEHRIRFTSIAEFAGWNERSVTASCVQVLRNRIQSVFPLVSAEKWDQGELRVGARPWCVDDLPVVGGTRFSNLWLNAGHGHTGWRLACATAEVLAAVMTDSKLPEAMGSGHLTLSRFESLWR